MSLEEDLKEKGWVEIRGEMRVTNVKTGDVKYHDGARRLVAPNGRATYRPGTGVLTSFSDDEHVQIN